jgi:hypothetical protein
MRNLRAILTFLLVLTLASCNHKSDNKQLKNKHESSSEKHNSAMIFTKDPNSNDITCISEATSEENLAFDLKEIFEKNHKQQLLNHKQIIIYIDATNGVLYISGYNSISDKHDDSVRIILHLSKLSERYGDDANNFDDIVISSLTLIEAEIDDSIKKNYEVYYQTESSDTEPLNW